MRKNTRNLLLQALAGVLLAGGALGAVNATGDQANASTKPTARTGSHATPLKAAAWPVLKTGARGNDVLTVQHLLAAHGHTVKTDKVFGRNTAAAVAKFQKRAGLKADGTVGPKTWAKLTALTLRTGSRGPAVKAVQVQLGLHPDGIYGTKTYNAVRAFQTRAGLKNDGVAGPKTWTALITGPSATTPGTKPAPRGYSLRFKKNPANPTNSRLILLRDGKEIDSYRAGSGLGSTDECAKARGWLPNGTYPITTHSTTWNGSVIKGYAIQLADKTCKPKPGHKPVKRTELFIHSEMTRTGGQGKDTPGRDDSTRWENTNDYKSLGCIKLTPTDIKDLFQHLNRAHWPKNLTLHVS
ncbi:peptidoglycan-binding protein [Streptomyces filamentosus]|uniref:L,D-transpeptidase family protein n=2 Tax=Streptomyces filamentosus TaxID=67294 RepID=UPI00331DD87A